MKEKITLLLLIFLCGLVTGYAGGRIISREASTEVIDWQINLIIPKTEKDLKKQILYNACSQEMLHKVIELGILKLEHPIVEKKEGIKKGGKN